MDDLRVLDFDILGTNPNNYIRNEKIPLKDATCPWIIPNGAPFFATNFELYDERGALISPLLYSFVGDFIPFTEVAGRSVWSFIELDESIRLANTFVTVNYRSIGAYFIPRNSLDEWLEKISTGVIPVGWEKVYGLPLTFNPSWHIHSAITDIGDWYELTWFFKALTDIRLTRDAGLSVDINTTVDEAYAELLSIKNEQMALLVGHDGNYNNPHGISRTHLQLGNRDNYRVATPAEEAEGISMTVLSTPRGARMKIQQTIPDTEQLMQNGVLPISLLGGGDFIPPTIDGSFEGLGSDNESTGICLENNGRLMLLTRHFDGRNKALYFSYAENYKANRNGNNILFTGFKYSHPVITPDVIVAGSNHKVMMVGKDNTAEWYLTLTNGTFNPASHSFVKVDMTRVIALAFNGTGGNYTMAQAIKACVHYMGDYIYLIQSTSKNGNGDSGTQYFFRVKVQDIINGNPVNWEHVKLTYVDYDGVSRTNFDYYQMITAVYDANSKLTRAGFGYNPPQNTYSGFYRKFVSYSGEHPTTKNRVSLHMIGHTFITYSIAGFSSSVGPDIDVAYEFNPVTGAMTLQDKSPYVVWDQNGVPRTTAGVATDSPCPFSSDMTFSTLSPAAVILPNGDLLNSNGLDSAKTYPRSIGVSAATILTQEWETCRRSNYALTKLAGYTRYRQFSVLASPLKSNVYPGVVNYCQDGEVYTALNQNSNTRSLFFRKVTGSYQKRSESTLINYPEALARPLTNEAYKTDIPAWMTTINMTGTTAQLASAGREMGDFGLSVGKFVNAAAMGSDGVFQGPRSGIPLCWPKAVSRQLNQDATADYNVDSSYGITDAMLAQLYTTYVPAGTATQKTKGLTIAMFPSNNGPMFNGITIGMMAFVYYTGASTCKLKLVTFRATIEAANAAHPAVDVITAFTALSVTEDVVITSVMDNVWNLGISYGTMVPNLQCYRNGGSMEFFWYTGFLYSVIGNSNVAAASGTVNLTSGAVTNFAATSTNWLPTPGITQMIPGVGASDSLYSANGASPSAQITQTAAGTQYLIASTFPSPLWSVFFKEGTRVLINGTKYLLPVGVVDLRDVDPVPANKTFYIYVTVDEDGAKYLITRSRLRHSNFLIPAATVVCGVMQVSSISTRQPFMIGDLILNAAREPGSIPASNGLPMDEGSFRYVYSSDLTS